MTEDAYPYGVRNSDAYSLDLARLAVRAIRDHLATPRGGDPVTDTTG
jgi:hypothetical protein